LACFRGCAAVCTSISALISFECASK
jgi:hypothetical protein